MTAREKQSRVLLLSSFFWTLGEADRSRLRRTMRELLERDDALTQPPADSPSDRRDLDRDRPPTRRAEGGLYLERTGVANRPGAYGA